MTSNAVKLIHSIILACALLSFFSLAKRPEFQLQLKNHLFYPAEIEIPENTKVKLIIFNQDSTPEEFDSFDLNREKVIFPEKKAVIFIGPLTPGRYEFFGEFNPNSAQGAIIVVPKSRAVDNDNQRTLPLTNINPKSNTSTVNLIKNNLLIQEVIDVN
ncbi:cupredoxin domain-containing protein [Colwellia sp. Arc7-635]|nr:cupredoxin domain-containing protein [Colwellia sp. Arc7-635]